MTSHVPPDLFLIAHSHGVALLDSVSNWRERGTVGQAAKDARYGAAFQGWFDGAVSAEPFETRVTGSGMSFRHMQAWVISSGSGIGELARLQRQEGAATLFVHPRLTEVLTAWNGATPIVSMLNGNEHAQALLNRFPAYDFIDPDVPGVEAGVPIIDAAFIDRTISDWIDAVLPALLAVRHAASNPFIHVLPPPPREHPERSSHFEVMDKLVATFGFLPWQTRLKWYRRYCRQLTARLPPLGIGVLGPPGKACTPEGLLKAEFAEGLTHGNAAYGRLVAEQLSSLLEPQ